MSRLLYAAGVLVIFGLGLWVWTHLRQAPAPAAPAAASQASESREPEPQAPVSVAAGPASGPLPPRSFAVCVFAESFEELAHPLKQWVATEAGDFHLRARDVVPASSAVPDAMRLRLRADTIGTDDRTVKYLGVRTLQPLALSRTCRLEAELDWNQQPNGCYLSAGLLLSPEAVTSIPATNPSRLRIDYIGVPPGKNARMEIEVCGADGAQIVYNENWPQDREGRPIGLQRLVLIIRDGALQVWENERLLYDSVNKILPFRTAYLYLQMSSHSNYRAREVFFSNIRVLAGKD